MARSDSGLVVVVVMFSLGSRTSCHGRVIPGYGESRPDEEDAYRLPSWQLDCDRRIVDPVDAQLDDDGDRIGIAVGGNTEFA